MNGILFLQGKLAEELTRRSQVEDLRVDQLKLTEISFNITPTALP